LSTAFVAVGSQVPLPHDMFVVAFAEITTSAQALAAQHANANSPNPHPLQTASMLRHGIGCSPDELGLTYHGAPSDSNCRFAPAHQPAKDPAVAAAIFDRLWPLEELVEQPSK
jgi:hypothetical protein